MLELCSRCSGQAMQQRGSEAGQAAWLERTHHERVLLLQAVCGIALVGLVSVGILGLVFGAAVGRRCAWCPSAACVDTRWWACQSTEQPICSYNPMGNGTASIECTGVRSSSSHGSAAAPAIRVHW